MIIALQQMVVSYSSKKYIYVSDLEPYLGSLSVQKP